MTICTPWLWNKAVCRVPKAAAKAAISQNRWRNQDPNHAPGDAIAGLDFAAMSSSRAFPDHGRPSDVTYGLL
ncbi:MAG: hypothetical protein WDN08_05700 [Rhizomicrobium sp.]